jgi:hypothetical protein
VLAVLRASTLPLHFQIPFRQGFPGFRTALAALLLSRYLQVPFQSDAQVVQADARSQAGLKARQDMRSPACQPEGIEQFLMRTPHGMRLGTGKADVGEEAPCAFSPKLTHLTEHEPVGPKSPGTRRERVAHMLQPNQMPPKRHQRRPLLGLDVRLHQHGATGKSQQTRRNIARG